MIRKITVIIIAALALQACGATSRLSQVGQTPPMRPIENPAVLAGTGPSQIPMPERPRLTVPVPEVDEAEPRLVSELGSIESLKN